MSDYLARLVGRAPHAVVVPRVASLYEVVLAAPEPTASLGPMAPVLDLPTTHAAAGLHAASAARFDAPASIEPSPVEVSPVERHSHPPAGTPAPHARTAIEPATRAIASEPSTVVPPLAAPRREEVEPPPHAAVPAVRATPPAGPGAVLRPHRRFDLAQQGPPLLAVRNARQATVAHPPPVEVHIGRIDVRAAETPPTPRRTRTAAPAPSLEAYLAERRR